MQLPNLSAPTPALLLDSIRGEICVANFEKKFIGYVVLEKRRYVLLGGGLNKIVLHCNEFLKKYLIFHHYYIRVFEVLQL